MKLIDLDLISKKFIFDLKIFNVYQNIDIILVQKQILKKVLKNFRGISIISLKSNC